MSDDDIVIHVVDQMYASDWFLEDTMTKWEEVNDNRKTQKQCQQFFKEVNIAQKQYIKAKWSMQESINKVVTDEWYSYIKAIELKAMQDRKEQEEYIQQVTHQNTMKRR